MGLTLVTYHPAQDIYHCIFRQLLLLENLPGKKSALDRLRILDFYLLFPSLLNEVRVPKSLVARRNKLADKPSSYEIIEDPYRLFAQLEGIQVSATRLLASCELVSLDEVRKREIVRTLDEIPAKLASAIQQGVEEKGELLVFLTGPFFNLDFYGPNGLKARTGLMVHTYDQ